MKMSSRMSLKSLPVIYVVRIINSNGACTNRGKVTFGTILCYCISCYILQACNNLEHWSKRQVCQKCKIQSEANEDSLAFLTSVQVIACLKKVQKCSMKQ